MKLKKSISFCMFVIAIPALLGTWRLAGPAIELMPFIARTSTSGCCNRIVWARFGPTDNGRWIPELLNDASEGEQHIIVTQNALGSKKQIINFSITTFAT